MEQDRNAWQDIDMAVLMAERDTEIGRRVKAESALTAAQARIEKLTAALGRFTLSCENIHHKRGEYHNSDEPCKALAAVEKAMGE